MSLTVTRRPLWGKILEILWQVLFYTNFGFYAGDVCKYLMNTWFFGGDVRFFAKFMFGFGKMLFSAVGYFFYTFCYTLNHPLLEKYRIQEWIWNRPETARTKAYELIRVKTAWALFVGEFMTSMGLYNLVGYLTKDVEEEELIRYITEEAPSVFENTWKLMAGYVFFEVVFYFGHLLLHTKWGYPYHKDHHAYYVTTSAAGSWGHFIDGLISFPIPGVSPVFIFNYHWYTMWCYTVVLGLHTHYDHGGYDFPFNPTQLIPFGSQTAAHNFHHSHVHTNFGLYWGIMDRIFGTNKEWLAHLDNLEETAEKVRKGEASKDICFGADGVLLVNDRAEMDDIASGNDNLEFSIKSVDSKIHAEITSITASKAKAE